MRPSRPRWRAGPPRRLTLPVCHRAMIEGAMHPPSELKRYGCFGCATHPLLHTRTPPVIGRGWTAITRPLTVHWCTCTGVLTFKPAVTNSQSAADRAEGEASRRHRCGGHRARPRSHCRFRNRGAAYVSESGITWMSVYSTKRQCDRALGGRLPAAVHLPRSPRLDPPRRHPGNHQGR
jgi:hypothetical protein